MKVLTALMLFAALPFFVACSNAPARDAVKTAAPASPAHAARVIVEAKEFAYSPDEVTVKAGQPVEIVLKNMGVTTHDFTIEKIALKEKAVANGDEHDMGAIWAWAIWAV